MDTLSVALQTAYAELVEELIGLDARRAIGHAPGTFVVKTIGGRTYHYFQYSTPGGTTRQAYLGIASRAMTAFVREYEAGRAERRSDDEHVRGLCAILRTGAGVTDSASARVLRALADSGVFKLGGVLVGTHAFLVLGNMLGVRWTGAHARTEDIDIASNALEIAVPELRADVPATLDSLKMGFLPIPSFSHRDPSTSFAVRGRALRLDLITPSKSRKAGAVPIHRFNAAAAPLSFVELLLADPQPAAVVNGGGILVHVPHPAHFALHKLIIAKRRAAAFHTKRDKDLLQAAHLVVALEELRPGDLHRAWKAAAKRGPGWARGLREGVALMRGRHKEAFSILESYT